MNNLVISSGLDGVGGVLAELGCSLVSLNFLDGVVSLVVVLCWLGALIGLVRLLDVLVLLVLWFGVRLLLGLLLLVVGLLVLVSLDGLLALGGLGLLVVVLHVRRVLFVTVWRVWDVQVVSLLWAGLQDVEACWDGNTDSSEGPG